MERYEIEDRNTDDIPWSYFQKRPQNWLEGLDYLSYIKRNTICPKQLKMLMQTTKQPIKNLTFEENPALANVYLKESFL